jgi:anti-sigma factor RsiW
MNHQPFENWLLSEEHLSQEETEALDAHLETCRPCRELNESWQGVLDLFQEAPDVEPMPGFTMRWQDRLTLERQMDQVVRHRWQSIIVLILIGNVIAGLVFLLSTQFLTTFDTPVSLFLTGVYRVISMVSLVNAAQNILATLFRTVTSVTPVWVWAVLGAGLVGSCVTWIISITSLSVLPRRS